MFWIKSGIENPSKSEVIGRCGRDEKNEWLRRTDKSQKLKKIINFLNDNSRNILYIYICFFIEQQSQHIALTSQIGDDDDDDDDDDDCGDDDDDYDDDDNDNNDSDNDDQQPTSK